MLRRIVIATCALALMGMTLVGPDHSSRVALGMNIPVDQITIPGVENPLLRGVYPNTYWCSRGVGCPARYVWGL